MSEPDAPSQSDALRVLIVDDDADQRAIVNRLLVDAGIPDVSEASDAEAGLAAAAGLRPHLILLDLVMPGRSGSDVLPDLLEAAPDALVVILSNLPRTRHGASLIQRGAVGYVEKLVPPERLVNEILIAAALTDIARRHVLDLPNESIAPLLGRRFARALVSDAELAIADDVALLVSELIANAIIHASSEPRLEVRISRSQVRVAVHDDSSGRPELRIPDAGGPGGRGLMMIDRLASRWGSDSNDVGKSVWFEIDREPSMPDR